MKATRLLFLMISYAALTPGTTYAGSSSSRPQEAPPETAADTVSDHSQDAGQAAPAAGGKRQKDRGPSGEQRDRRHVSGKNQPRSLATEIKVRPKQLPNNRERFPSRNAMNFHQPGSDKPSGAAKAGLIQHETVKTAVPRRPPSVTRPSVPLLNNVRHRGANPAVIGGPANSAGRNTGAINGTVVHRRP
jgi:hypothetical protein